MEAQEIQQKELHTVRGELALLVAVLINSFGVVLMLHSGAGISAISSVPFAFSEVFTRISLGTWTYLFQGVLVLSLMILRKRFVPQYLFSFVVGFVFGELLDVHEAWINLLPLTLPNRILYFAISYLLICIGIALSNRCGLPIIPTDLFPRELADITGAAYSNIKVSFDVICLAVTARHDDLLSGTSRRTWNRNDSGGVYDGKGDRGDREMDGRAFAVRVGSDS